MRRCGPFVAAVRRRHALLERPHGVGRDVPVQLHPCKAWPFPLSCVDGRGLLANAPHPAKERHQLETKAQRRQRAVLLASLDDAPF